MNKTFVDVPAYDCPSCSKKQIKYEVRDTPMQKSWHCPGCHFRIRVESRFRRK